MITYVKEILLISKSNFGHIFIFVILKNISVGILTCCFYTQDVYLHMCF